jgi:hypothetical protein
MDHGSLQETPLKELMVLAKTALRLVHWHPFPISYLPSAVRAVLDAAADTVWKTRVAALTFIQSFVYRYALYLYNKLRHIVCLSIERSRHIMLLSYSLILRSLLITALCRHIFILAREDVEALWARVQQLLSDPQVEV